MNINDLRKNFNSNNLKSAVSSTKKSNCEKRMDIVIKKYRFYDDKKYSKNKLIILITEVDETISFVNGCYEKSQMPDDIVKKYLQLNDIRSSYIKIEKNKEINDLKKEITELRDKIEQTIENSSNAQKNAEKAVEDAQLALDKSDKANKNIWKINAISKKLDGIWGNVLSVILSFTIVATLVETIDKIEPQFIFLLAIILIWLGMTLFVFFSCLFKDDGEFPSCAKTIYVVYSVFCILAAVVTLYYTIALSNKDNEVNSCELIFNSNIVEK